MKKDNLMKPDILKKKIRFTCSLVLVLCMAAGLTMTAWAAPAADGNSAVIVWPDMFGDQEGLLSLDPESNTWELSFENPYGSYLIAGDYSPEDGSMTCTDDAGMGNFLPLDAIYAAGQEQITAILEAEANGTDEMPEAGEMPAAEESEVGAAISEAEGEGVDMTIVWPDMFGDQEGLLSLDPESNTWELSFENPYGSYLIAGDYSPEDGSMTCTDDAGMGNFLPLDAIYAAGQEQIAAFLEGGTYQAAEIPSEEIPAETADDDFEAFKEIITWDVMDFPMVFEQLPDAYNTYDTPYKGSDFFIEYTTDVYGDGVTYEKFARVYLPYCYDAEDTETKYNILYLQHGNNCSPSNFFDLVPPTGNFRNLLDNLFDPEHGLMEPCIIVCPTYYLDIEKEDVTVPDGAIAGDGRYEGIPALYHREVVEDLIPAVESQLNVYCEDFSEEGIKATRDHRAWGGYSRGSVCTWYMFHNDLEYFRYWMPTSAQCMPEGIVLGDPNEQEWTDEDAFQYLKEAVDAHPDLPFYIIAQSGAPNDATAMRSQMKCFADHSELFSYGLNPEVNNFYYTCADFQHVQQYFAYYLYTARNILFK